MSSLWELSTDNVVTILIVICISALAIAWLFAGRSRPKNASALERNRLVGREAEEFVPVAPSISALNPIPQMSPQEEQTNEADEPVKAVMAVKTEPALVLEDVDSPEPNPVQTLETKLREPTPRSAEQASAISIAAALVRHDKREAPTTEECVAAPPPTPINTGGDDLTALSGIDHAVAAELNDLGIHHYDQISAWTPEYAHWVTSQLSASLTGGDRNTWISEAKALTGQPAPEGQNRVIQSG